MEHTVKNIIHWNNYDIARSIVLVVVPFSNLRGHTKFPSTFKEIHSAMFVKNIKTMATHFLRFLKEFILKEMYYIVLFQFYFHWINNKLSIINNSKQSESNQKKHKA